MSVASVRRRRARFRWAPALAALVLVVLLAPSFGSPTSAAPPRGLPSPLAHRAGSPTVARPAGFPTPIRHVIVVVLENANRSQVVSTGPYESGLLGRYATDSKYYAICHPSAPNYLALTSGASYQCGSDAWNTYPSTNLGDELDAANRTWAGFDESMPTPCDTANSYPYAVKHNPFVYYRDIVTNSTRCDAHDRSFSDWNADVANGTIPNFAFVTPNLTDDGHDTGVAYADAWLDGWLSPIVNASWFASSAVFVVYDESSPNDNTGYNGTQGGGVYFAAVSPYARPGYDLATNASHYNLLSTVEWLLGTRTTGHNDSSTRFAPMTGLFQFPTPLYDVNGTVDSSASHLPVAGATVNLTGDLGTTTNGTGEFSFFLPNGSYALVVAARGYLPYRTTLSVNGSALSVPVELLPSTTATYALRGSVAGRPSDVWLANVTVSLNSTTRTLTDVYGAYAFEVPNGTYHLNLTVAGYTPLNGTAWVHGADVWKNFSMDAVPPPTFPVTGTVSSTATGLPIAGAVVSSGTGVAASAGPSGVFQLALPNGSYTLSAVAPGFQLNRTSVSVDGSPAVANVRLDPMPNGSAGPGGAFGLPIPLLWLLVGLGGAAVVGTVAVLVRRRRRSPR